MDLIGALIQMYIPLRSGSFIHNPAVCWVLSSMTSPSPSSTVVGNSKIFPWVMLHGFLIWAHQGPFGLHTCCPVLQPLDALGEKSSCWFFTQTAKQFPFLSLLPSPKEVWPVGNGSVVWCRWHETLQCASLLATSQLPAECDGDIGNQVCGNLEGSGYTV